MQVNVAGLRRNIKNLAHNYSDAQVKVREATSNDPWGPSATIMAEIADLTYNVVAFSEIMQMIWKRLNDHGKNWRHVYKALILLEYLIKTGTEKVAQQCKENIFAIQTLKEFVYFEEGKDQGTHVREKAKQLVNLLKDDDRLKNERIKALKAKERFAQHPSGFGSDGYIDGPTHRDMPPGWQEEPKVVSDLEMVRPQTAGEEELQLQLAMAMSREEAEQEEAKRRSDDVRLQLALSQSEQDFKEQTTRHHPKQQKEEQQSHLLDLLEISLGATSISSPPLGATGGVDPWGPGARAASQLSDPWSGTSSPPIDPWHPTPASRSNVPSMPLGAVGGSDAWAMRTQSPSLASGSSTEGWLQTNGTNSIMNGNGASTSSGAAGAAALPADPWLGGKGNSSSAPVAPIATTSSVNADPWISESSKPKSVKDDPWATSKSLAAAISDDPWKSLENNEKKISPDLDDFDIITNRNKAAEAVNSNLAINNNNALLLDDMDPLSNSASANTNNITSKKPLKTPQAFLGENSSLVNLDNLIKPIAPQGQPGAAYNPFSDTVLPPKTNLFQQQQPAVPSINQLKQQQPFAMALSQDPWAPAGAANISAQQENLFLNNEEIENINPNPYYKPRPNTLSLNTSNQNINSINSNNSQNSTLENKYLSENISNRNMSNLNNVNKTLKQQEQQENSRDYDVFNTIHQYESVFDDQPSTNRSDNYNKTLYGELGSINNFYNQKNNYELYPSVDNGNYMTASPPFYEYDSNEKLYRATTSSQLSTRYSNDFLASLAGTPGIRVEPKNKQTTIATVHASYSGDVQTPPIPQTGFTYHSDNLNFNYQSGMSQMGLNNLGRGPYSTDNNMNNNVSWMKPEAAASNPFLS